MRQDGARDGRRATFTPRCLPRGATNTHQGRTGTSRDCVLNRWGVFLPPSARLIPRQGFPDIRRSSDKGDWEEGGGGGERGVPGGWETPPGAQFYLYHYVLICTLYPSPNCPSLTLGLVHFSHRPSNEQFGLIPIDQLTTKDK